MNFGFTTAELGELDLAQFDEAVELVNAVYKRHRRDELLRIATGAQGTEKSIKDALKAYNREGETPIGTRSAAEFLKAPGVGMG